MTVEDTGPDGDPRGRVVEDDRIAAEIERAWAERFRELLEANRRLRDLARHRQELLASCARDLRGPLEVATAAARDLAGHPEFRGTATALHTAAHGIRELADTLDTPGIDALPELRPGAEERPRTRPVVLVVEDDPDTVDLLSDLLEDDAEVHAAADGEAGVRDARALVPDAILLDLYLPRLDGFGVLEELRRDPRTSDVPVIFLSAQRDDLVRARGLHLGAADFVVKPFSAAELRARLDRVLLATRQQAHLRALAQQDALTGLPNFGAFRARLEEEVKRARRYRNDLAAVMLDMDNLKPVNDQLGHAAGNRAIVAIADAIREELRETDFAARYGGDEFVILLPHADTAHAASIAERLRQAVRRIQIDGGAVPLRASFGVAALSPDDEGGGEELLRAADAALYRAKRTGRDKVCVAGEEAAPPPEREAVDERP
jgi:two-component system cell cycle response regulator